MPPCTPLATFGNTRFYLRCHAFAQGMLMRFSPAGSQAQNTRLYSFYTYHHTGRRSSSLL